MQGSRNFSLLVSGQEAFYNTLLQLIDPDDENAKETKDKQAVFSQAKKNSDQLKELEIELLNDDTNKYLTEDLYDYVEEEARKQLLLSPEDYAFNLG
jgi:cell division protein FtsB